MMKSKDTIDGEETGVTGSNMRKISENYKNDPLHTEFTPKADSSSDESDTKYDKNGKKKKKKKKKEEEKDDGPPPVGFFSLFRYASASDKFALFIGFLSAVVTGLCVPANTLLFGNLTGTMVDFGSSFMNSTTPPDWEAIEEEFLHDINVFAINNSIIGVAMLVMSYLSIMLFNLAAQRQIFRIRNKFFYSALHQDIGWYDLNQSGEFASRMAEDLSKLEEGIGEKVVMFVHFQVAFLGSLTLALVKGWELALICLSSLPVTMIAVGLVSIVTSSLSKKELTAYGKAGSIAEEVLSSIRTVMAFGGQNKEVERYQGNLIFAKKNNIKRGFFSGLGFGLLWFFIYASYALAFWYGVGLVLEERHLPQDQITYDAATMVTVFFSVMMGSMNFGISSPYIEVFAIAKGAGAKVYSVIERISPIDSASPDGAKPDKMNGSITFKGVKFNYPSRVDVKILRGLDLTINRGETVALVGSSGCGKSTCIQLIQRFYDPLEGTVCLDGVDVKELNVEWLRSQIGVVGQEPILFGTTIAENIRFGMVTATLDQIKDAAREANAHDFITKLPQGYDTLVGERGAQMSGGQKQRIAIARALIRQPAILLLDEATSALDTGSEAKVQAALDKASRGRTTVIVAHRLSTIRGADKIVVIAEGQVVEEGTHDELMKLDGHYHRLVTAQIMHGEDEDDEEGKEEDVPAAKKLSRMMSITSASSHASSTDDVNEAHSHAIVEDEKFPEVPIKRIMAKNKQEWPYILIGCVSSIVMGCAMPLFAVLFGDILGILSLPDDTDVRDQTNIYCIYFLCAGLAVGFATFLQIYSFGVAGENLTLRLRALAFAAMVRQEVAWFDNKVNSTGSLCARLSGDAASVQGATGQRIGTILQSLATLFLGVGLSLAYEWRLGLVALSFTPIILIANYAFAGAIRGESLNNQAAMENSTKLAVEAVGNIRTVVSLGREQTFHDQYMAELAPAHKVTKRNNHMRGIVFGLARSIMFFAFATCMYYGGQLVADEGLPYATVFKVSQALIMGTVSIANSIAFAPNFQKGLLAAAKIFALLDRKPKVYDPSHPIPGSDKWVAQGHVNFSGVEFFYETRSATRVLRGLNLIVKPGQTVALVGQSGCGKSTCIQLLERFYDPTAGMVSIDDKDISTVTLSTLRSQLGIVSQEPILFDRTIAENISYGDNTRNVQMDEVISAAKNANIHNFIASLPLGYETRMGEKGAQLSGGQKQRVAIARALIRNPRILLLDEATSALDTESEKVVQEALDKAKEGRTCITIAHRLSTIQDADLICVINRGKIAEMGKHGQLLAQRGLYYKLHNLQGGQQK